MEVSLFFRIVSLVSEYLFFARPKKRYEKVAPVHPCTRDIRASCTSKSPGCLGSSFTSNIFLTFIISNPGRVKNLVFLLIGSFFFSIGFAFYRRVSSFCLPKKKIRRKSAPECLGLKASLKSNRILKAHVNMTSCHGAAHLAFMLNDLKSCYFLGKAKRDLPLR